MPVLWLETLCIMDLLQFLFNGLLVSFLKHSQALSPPHLFGEEKVLDQDIHCISACALTLTFIACSTHLG